MKKKLIAASLICVCLMGAGWFFSPKIRANVFVALHDTTVEDAYQAGIYPDKIGHWVPHKQFREHPIVEFTLFSFGLAPGTSYYGCYYSPDDVPVPFQHVNVPLSQKDDGIWEWTGDGDNYGTTAKMKEHWYYFEAHF